MVFGSRCSQLYPRVSTMFVLVPNPLVSNPHTLCFGRIFPVVHHQISKRLEIANFNDCAHVPSPKYWINGDATVHSYHSCKTYLVVQPTVDTDSAKPNVFLCHGSIYWCTCLKSEKPNLALIYLQMHTTIKKTLEMHPLSRMSMDGWTCSATVYRPGAVAKLWFDLNHVPFLDLILRTCGPCCQNVLMK